MRGHFINSSAGAVRTTLHGTVGGLIAQVHTALRNEDERRRVLTAGGLVHQGRLAHPK
jgi:hypothetical protein